MSLSRRLGVLALALLLPTAAMADPKDDARRHFMAGLEAAADEQYEVALQHFLSAQDAYPHPATLYNIAKAYADLGDLPNALTYYRLFADASPDKAADVEPIIAVLAARLGQEQGRAVAPSTTTTRTATPGTISRDVVIVGPSEEEFARLSALLAELDALSQAWVERQTDEVAAIEAAIAEAEAAEAEGGEGEGGEGEGEGGEGEGGGEGELDIPNLPQEGFMSDAYGRVVVTASRYGQDPLDSPSTISVLTAEDVRLSGATTVPDLLRRVVGVEAMQLASGHTDISIRGFNRELSNKILLLIDGRSTYFDFIGATLSNTLPITLEEIERIEVIRGPASAVYGANAVTGIVNIITRTPGEGENKVRADFGSPLYGLGSVLLTGREKSLSYRFSAGYQQQGRWGWDLDPAGYSSLDTFFEDQTIGLKALRANGRVDTTFLDKGFASLSGGLSQSSFDFYNIGALGEYGMELNHAYLRGDFAYGPVHFRAFWNSDDGVVAPWTQLMNNPRDLTSPIDSDVVDAELEANHEFTTGAITHRVHGGVGYRLKRIADFSYIGQEEGDPPITENHYSAFLSEEASFWKMKLVAQVRADVHPLIDIGQTLSPRAAAIVRVADKTSVRASGGSAFRAPNQTENYMDLQLGTGVDGVYVQDYGDVDLVPEQIWTAEIGVHDESTLFHTADLAVYYNELGNIISLQDVTSTREPIQPRIRRMAGRRLRFVHDTRFQGFGVEGEVELFPIDGLDVYGNFDYTSIVEIDAAGNRSPDESTSKVKINAGTMYRTPFRTDLTLDMHYLTKQVWGLREFDAAGAYVAVPYEIPSRLILSARVAARPLPDERLEISGTLWNIAGFFEDQRFREHPKGQFLGPRAYGSLTYTF